MMNKKRSDMRSKIFTIIAVVLFLGTISVFAGNILVSENGIQSSNYYSSDGSGGLTQNITYLDGYGETQVLVVKNGIIVDANEGMDAVFPSAGLTAYYKLDDTTGSVVDQLGDNPGTNNGATRGAIGKINNSFSFDGINDYVSLGTETFSSDSNGTISFWFKSPDTSSSNEILFSAGSTSSNNLLRLINTGSKKFELQRYAQGSINDAVDGNTTLTENTWHHVVIISDGSDWYLYLDGYPESLTVIAGSNSGRWFNNLPASYEIALGREYVSGFSYWEGNLDEFGYWSRKLNSTEISNLYNNGYGLTYSA